MTKRGRPRKEICPRQFEVLCGLQCTAQEMCAALSVSRTTLWRFCRRHYGMNFETIFAEKRLPGFVRLRLAQWRLAMQGNTKMLVWLGKQYLGQSNKAQPASENSQLVEAFCAGNVRFERA